MPVDREKASEMLDEFERAVVAYERAHGDAVPGARKAEAAARKALFEALTGGSDA